MKWLDDLLKGKPEPDAPTPGGVPKLQDAAPSTNSPGLAPGSRVWVRSEDAEEAPFALAVVLQTRPEQRTISCKGEDGATLLVPVDAVSPANAAIQDDCEDIAQLSHLSEPSLFHLVQLRYRRRRQIYTRAGPILLALNPFCRVDQLYSCSAIEAYAAAAGGGTTDAASGLAPHVYEIAAAAYEDLRRRSRSQSVIINGESGAGKTETAKIILKFLTQTAVGASAGAGSAVAGSAAAGSDLSQRLHQSSPVLESFGNCRTARNDNSSRFGKLVKLHFSSAGALLGGSVARYLLEKSRVVAPEEGERSYHSFYQLCAGAGAELRQPLGLADPAHAAEDFFYLMRGKCLAVDGVDDAANFGEVSEALGALLMAGGEGQDEVWRCLGAILHLGNVEFEVEGEGEAEGEVEQVQRRSVEGARGAAVVSAGSLAALPRVAELLGVGCEPLSTCLLKRTIVAGTELCELRKSCAEAEAARDALAKALYERLFDFLVETINRSLASDGGVAGRGAVAGGGAVAGRASGRAAGGGGAVGGANVICLLDIFGMECLQVNGFDQLLINFANEKLQQHFTRTAISLVQAEPQ